MKEKKKSTKRVKFRCTKCKYEFFPLNKDRTAPFARCPYCGTEGTIVEKKHVLSELY